MEIQWVMLAKEIRTNPDTTMCIDGIFHRISSTLFMPSVILIAKVNPIPADIGQTKIIELDVYRDSVRIGGTKLQYKVRDEDTWESRYPYAILQLGKGSINPGKYTFKLSIANESYNQESIIVK